MELTKEIIDQLANLARLEFKEADTIQIKDDLAKMISFVEKLQEIDTEGVEPMLHMTDQMDVVRNDELKGSMDRVDAIALAPDADSQYFFVPKVIKK
ncbi:Asp-tRNA(Asn)/Glu-tRNA(Gln) amidotransferase subunit GatC [Flavihumibacter profundi]|uniref:Asp-tRNA(Asn)/Glu-tRNA(Gln) amidotransferase subunit GatC n=1 Tax=Flavihumibacter profundi TaxID=2716883 RepID=UPI001CC63F46|nr:Asp-tRNA(Asn)/Glu-tRNA(Gln) amidotransferase subunit GatC [Flavihumibacter profundi]MBZ5859239.1 Asp-tRNA(Asn)/Glu-tRNA(Gln) amidotransferase subunit GatC [Flavihumibacter profundi]